MSRFQISADKFATYNTPSGALLRFIVSERGTVVDPEVIDSEPAGVFDETAIQAIRQFEYEPKTMNGRVISTPNVFHMFKFRPSK